MDKEIEYLEICDDLKRLIEDTGEPLEGNCMYRHLSFDPWDCLLNKRKNYQTIARAKKKICEIGFNAGHSLLVMLLANPKARYLLFDLGSHRYSRACYEHLKKRFPDTRIDILWGDSRDTMPAYHLEHPDDLFDVIHIDGGHSHEVYSKDWEHALVMVSVGGILIFDDTDNKKISAFVDEEIRKGVVGEDADHLETSGYEHRILVKLPFPR